MHKKSTSRSAFFNPRVVIALVISVATCSIVTVPLLAFLHPQGPSNASQRTLTFEERVSYQRAIEDVYWRHRIWPRENPGPKPSLDAVVSPAQLEKKVANYLRNSQALEDYWQRPITAEQLQAEMERMAKHTKQPEVLQELLEALGNDPFVIAECLARPALAERLVTNWYAHDQRFHGELKQRAVGELQAHPSTEQMKRLSGKYNEIELAKSHSGEPAGQAVAAATLPNKQVAGGAPALQRRDSGHRVKLSASEWEETIQKLSAAFGVRQHVAAFKGADMSAHSQNKTAESFETIPIGKLSQLQEDENRYYVTAVIKKADDRLKLATVSWPKEPLQSWLTRAENQFSVAPAAPHGSYRLPAILGGGCVDNTWAATAAPPQARNSHTAVWTGSEMIIWGGQSNSSLLDSGGRYDPATDTWTFTNSAGAPTARSGHTAVWTGSEMIVWGGQDQNGPPSVNTGGKYDPGTDSWTPTSTANAPDGRSLHSAVWTGSQMIVWGGNDIFNGDLNTGGRYNPDTNSWTATTTTNAPSARSSHTAVLTGGEMIIWGGFDNFNFVDLNTGGKYDPNTNSWTATSTSNVPDARYRHTAVSTDTEMIVWGGFNNESFEDLNTGGRYNPDTDTWTATSTFAPDPRENHTAVWAGNEMIVWGGSNGFSLNTGGRYDPGTDSWTAISTTNAPDARVSHTAVWTGSEMIVWGGSGGFPFGGDLNTGGRYDPGTNSWTATNTYDVPDPRSGHTAIWTGTEMVVWGGAGQSFPFGMFDTGARYDLATDSWAPTSITDAPSARNGHTAVWTGTQMIVWGGQDDSSNYLNTGGKYNPGADNWVAMTGIAPLPRSLHTAVWTGREMIIWGGNSDFGLLNTGGRYNPGADNWTQTNTNAPDARDNHTAVWTDGEMIVWGGDDNNFSKLNTGGRYNPATNSWISTSTINAPSARDFHTAVWTASEMIVWGGADDNFSFPSAGGRYKPASDSWIATNAIAPEGREGHTAVWTGTQMLVWGGHDDNFTELNTGGQYIPGTDTWTATNTTNAPAARELHTAVWTGSETGSQMIVWGGSSNNTVANTGGSYCAQGAPIPTPTPPHSARPTPTPRVLPTPHHRPTPH